MSNERPKNNKESKEEHKLTREKLISILKERPNEAFTLVAQYEDEQRENIQGEEADIALQIDVAKIYFEAELFQAAANSYEDALLRVKNTPAEGMRVHLDELKERYRAALEKLS